MRLSGFDTWDELRQEGAMSPTVFTVFMVGIIKDCVLSQRKLHLEVEKPETRTNCVVFIFW